MTTNTPGHDGAVGFSFPPELFKPLIQQAVKEAIAQRDAARDQLPEGRLAWPEAEAAPLLGLKDHQLRDERRRGRVQAARGPGDKILYTRQHLLEYLANRPWNPKACN